MHIKAMGTLQYVWASRKRSKKGRLYRGKGIKYNRIMKKLILLTLCCLWACVVFAQVGVLSVSDEDMHTRKEDFWHTFEYYAVIEGGKASKCQATRVGKDWYATAAHCVAEPCQNGCTLRIDLLEQPYSIFASISHTNKKPVIFVHPQYDPDEVVTHDFALLNIDLDHADIRYYRRPQGRDTQNHFVPKREFDDYLRKQVQARRELDNVLRPKIPPLLTFSKKDGRLDRELSVISIFNGRRHILHNPHPTDYVSQLGFAYTKNFGVREGMSGSGVMTNTGELAGIISGYLGIEKKDGSVEYFMFSVFNKDLTDFMEEIMGSDYYKLDRRSASHGYLKKTKQNHKDMIEAVEELGRQAAKKSD